MRKSFLSLWVKMGRRLKSEGDSSNINGEDVGGLGSDAEGGVCMYIQEGCVSGLTGIVKEVVGKVQNMDVNGAPVVFEEMRDPEKVDNSNVCLDGDSLGVKEDFRSGLGSDFKQKGNISLETRVRMSTQRWEVFTSGATSPRGNKSWKNLNYHAPMTNQINGVLRRQGSELEVKSANMLYSISKDKSMRVWNCHTGQCGEVVNFGDECGCLMCEGPCIFVGFPNAIKIFKKMGQITGDEEDGQAPENASPEPRAHPMRLTLYGSRL
ncbi:hypothetical protein AgCh_025459 [Apium graveolens]